MIDLDRVRRDTPGVEHVAHLNNAGSALPPRQVLDATVEYLQREAQIGGYETAHERRADWEHTYDALAQLLNASREEIAVIENATRAWDMAFYSFLFKPGDRILTGRAEYASNWIALKQVADRTGASIEVNHAGGKRLKRRSPSPPVVSAPTRTTPSSRYSMTSGVW